MRDSVAGGPAAAGRTRGFHMSRQPARYRAECHGASSSGEFLFRMVSHGSSPADFADFVCRGNGRGWGAERQGTAACETSAHWYLLRLFSWCFQTRIRETDSSTQRQIVTLGCRPTCKASVRFNKRRPWLNPIPTKEQQTVGTGCRLGHTLFPRLNPSAPRRLAGCPRA